MAKLEFVETAKKVRREEYDSYKVGIFLDGCGFFSGNAYPCSFSMVPGRKYKITIENVYTVGNNKNTNLKKWWMFWK